MYRCTTTQSVEFSVQIKNSASRTSYIVLFSTSFQTEHLDQPIPPSRLPPVYIPNKSICNCSTSKNFFPNLLQLACLLFPVRCSHSIAKVRERKKKIKIDSRRRPIILHVHTCFLLLALPLDTTNDTTIHRIQEIWFWKNQYLNPQLPTPTILPPRY